MKALINKLFAKKAAPAEAAEQQPKVKSALLQTYFTSLLSLVLCAAMFLGTSYAWFTSEVNNTGNEIYIGVLDVGLYRQEETKRLDLSDSANKLFDRNIRWEPGYTSLETVHVVNEGDLAFKYVLSFTDGKLGTTGAEQGEQGEPVEQDLAKLQAVAKYFDVWVYNDAENTTPTATDIDQIAVPGSGWVNAGTLDQLLAGTAVFTGKMEAPEVRHIPQESQQSQEAQPGQEETQPVINPGTTDGKATEKTYTIALHMQRGADISVMGQKLTLNVKLVAYQLPSEGDEFGTGFDRMVATAAELEEALKVNGTAVLVTDIDLSKQQLTVPADVKVTLDLNGHKLTGTVQEPVSLITNNGDLTIIDSAAYASDVNEKDKAGIAITFAGTVNGDKAVNAIANRGKLTVNGGIISNTCTTNGLEQIGYAIDNYNGAILTVNGGKITATGSGYYDGIRLFCGSAETLVTVNGGEISTIWAQNPSTGKASEVKGTVIVNGGKINNVFYENYTTVKVADGVEVTVTPYGAGKDNVESNHNQETGYTTHNFKHS